MNINLLTAITSYLPHLETFFYVFLRTGAVMALLPAFGENSLPVRVRLALAFAFSMIIFPLLLGEYGPINQPGFLAILGEIIAGLTLGIILRTFVFALQIVGAIVAQSTSLSQIFGAANTEPQPAIGHILFWAGLCVALSNGLPIRAIEAMLLSYEAIPIGNLPTPTSLSNLGVSNIAHCFSLAFSLSAPFVIASLLYNIAIGVINRAMPQLMVAMVGAPAITLGGIALLLLIAPLILGIWWQSFSTTLQSPFMVPN